jgi:hypothetical protein
MLGERIAPKMFTSNKIDCSGNLINTKLTVFGRMIPIMKIIEDMQERYKDLQRPVNTESQ